MRCFLVALSLALSMGCSRRQPAENAAGGPAPSVRIALVTDLKGYLEPCGCTSNPLGGIDRMASEIRRLDEEDAPLLFLIAGDTFFDTASIEPARVDQANRNAKALAGILNRLEVTAVLAGSRDRSQPSDTIEAVQTASDFPWLAMGRPTGTVSVEAGELRILVVGVRPGTERDVVAAAVAAERPNADLTIVLIDGSRRDANRIGAIEGVDFVVQGGLDQDAPLPPRRADEAWVLHASRQGQGITVVDVYRGKNDGPYSDQSAWSRETQADRLERQINDLSAKVAAWESERDIDPADLEAQRARLARLEKKRRAFDAPSNRANGNRFSAEWVPLKKGSRTDPEVEKLMRAHDKAVNDANRVAFADLKPPPLGPEDVAYAGSAACSACHDKAYTWWRNHAHGVAYLTLQQRNKEYNLDCVGCHVTGYQQPGGSTVTHNLDGQLKNVGCESCHGPGAAHVRDPEVAVVRMTPESACVSCHNEQHSDLFDYETYVKTLVVPGHGLPVKEPPPR